MENKGTNQEMNESVLNGATTPIDTITRAEIDKALQEKGEKPIYKKEKVAKPKSYEFTSSGEIIEPNVELKNTTSKEDIINYIQMQKRIVNSTFTFDKGKTLTLLNNLIQYINSCN